MVFMAAAIEETSLQVGKNENMYHLFLMVPMHSVDLTFQYRNDCKACEMWLTPELTSDIKLDLHSWELLKI